MIVPSDPNPIEAAAAVRQQAIRECAAAIAVWEDGINRLMRSIDPLRGIRYQRPDEDQEPALFALLAQAVNHQLAMHSLALDGYYVEALGLIRPCVERWLAWWYVTNFPDKASRFIRPGTGDTPEWGEMLKKLEQGTKDEAIRRWWKWLNKLAHVDHATLGLMWWEPAEGGEPIIRLGPSFDSKLLEDCVGEAASVIPPLLEITDKLCERYGVDPPEPDSPQSYLGRLMPWLQQLDLQRHGQTRLEESADD